MQYETICGMQSPHHPTVPCSPRPWPTRGPEECAFPVSGEGASLNSCCNPCPGTTYCEAHRQILKGPPAPPIEQVEAQLRGLGI